MERLGTVLHIINNKTMIVKCDDMKSTKSFKRQLFNSKGVKDISNSFGVRKFRINSVVVTQSVKSIGTIKDIIGPVDHPYASIKIFKNVSTSDLQKCINERVYVQ